MTTKTPLLAGRVRRPPASGWSWIDRSFLADHAPFLSTEAILLYMFWTAVADKMGLSCWGDAAIAARLHIGAGAVVCGREELVMRDLIAYRHPVTQVLMLPVRAAERRDSGPMSLGEILRTAAAGIQFTREERTKP